MALATVGLVAIVITAAFGLSITITSLRNDIRQRRRRQQYHRRGPD